MSANVVSTSYSSGVSLPINSRGSGRLSDGTTRVFIMYDIISTVPTATLYTSPDGGTWTSKATWAVGSSGVTPPNMRNSFVVDNNNNIHVVYSTWAVATSSGFSYVKLTYSAGSFSVGTPVVLHTAIASRVINSADIDLIGSSTQYPIFAITYQSTANANNITLEYFIVKSTTATSLYSQTNTLNTNLIRPFISGCKAFESDGTSAYFVASRFSTTGTNTLDATTIESVLVLVQTTTPVITSTTRNEFQPLLSGGAPIYLEVFQVGTREVMCVAHRDGTNILAFSRFSYANSLTPAITRSYTATLATIPSYTVSPGSHINMGMVDNNYVIIFFFNNASSGTAVVVNWTVATLGSAIVPYSSSIPLLQYYKGGSHGGGVDVYAGPFDLNTGCNRNVDFGVHDPDLIMWSATIVHPFF